MAVPAQLSGYARGLTRGDTVYTKSTDQVFHMLEEVTNVL